MACTQIDRNDPMTGREGGYVVVNEETKLDLLSGGRNLRVVRAVHVNVITALTTKERRGMF